jgi:hypothetical protein
MSEKEPGSDQPHPRQSFGHPVTAVARNQFSDHKPGHDESPPPVPAAEKGRAHAVLPPHNPNNVPKTSLSARIRELFGKKE